MARYVVGIDLGTSNCAIASVEPSLGAKAPVVDLPVPQLIRPGETAARALYPSAVYLPFEGEFPAGSLALPWATRGAATITGELARWQGSRVPGRVVTSAKSWLIHQGVDRQAPILPWGTTADVPRVSPVAAQAELLRHLANAWNHAHPDALLTQQEVVLTIPASFDEAARALTIQAARDAGFDLQRVTLLEEPSAAFYDFTARHRSTLSAALAGVRLVLVVDVGGGTTDFSLVQVAMLPEGPALKRIAVGDHVLLGGDNMDAALARLLEAKAVPAGRFSGPQWTQALQVARSAKEAMLGAAPVASQRLTIAGAGAKLLGGTLSAELTREEVERTVVDGFFPSVTNGGEAVAGSKRGAVVELGLPYAKDPAITRHLLAFLQTHAAIGHAALGASPSTTGLPRPDVMLLNGGVFNSPRLTQALVSTVSALWPNAPAIPLLEHDSLDLAVARGAAYSGLARKALGQKIGGGAPRAIYALVSDGSASELAPAKRDNEGRGAEARSSPELAPAKRDNEGRGAEARSSPELAPTKRGVCLVPRGLEEGSTVELSSRTFTLTLGRPVQFQLMSTTADRLDKPGDVVELVGDEFKSLPALHTILQGDGPPVKGKLEQVPVHLVATLTEVGTLALSLVAQSTEKRWRLEFELRGTAKSHELTVTESMPARFTEASTEVERVFGTRPLPVEPKDVKNLFRTLEKLLGPREGWTVPVLRELWTPLWAGVSKRRRSAEHEKVMYQLLGFSLRPGTGYPLDAWRCEQTFSIFKDLVTNHGEQAIWAEFWVLWRRIAGGLPEAAQKQMWATIEPSLQRRVPVGLPQPKEKLKGIALQGLEEMVRLAASLELLEVRHKVELGGWIRSRLAAPDTAGGPWVWALGRLGAREPVQGATHRVVPSELATEWIDALLALDQKKHDGVPFALSQLGRRTGDRSRDLDEPVRAKVIAALEQAKAPESWRRMVSEIVHLSAADEARALGDTLPLGLIL